MKDTAWLDTVGKKAETPKFEEIARSPEKLMRFTSMTEGVLSSGIDAESGDLVIRVANNITRTIKSPDVPHIQSALRKLHLNTATAAPRAGGDATAPAPVAEKLNVEEIRALSPFLEKYSRATQTLDAFQGEDRFTDEEIKGLVNWASKNSPELGGVLAQLGNRPDFFARALKTLAYAPNPRDFLTLRAKLEAARNIAIRDMPLHAKLTELGEKYGVPVQDMLDAIERAPSVADASRELQKLIVPAFGPGKLGGLFSKEWLNKGRAKAAVLAIEIEMRLNPFLARRKARKEALGSEDKPGGISEALLRLVVGARGDDGKRVGTGQLSNDFANEIIGIKGSPDYDSSQASVREATAKVRGITDAQIDATLRAAESRRSSGISDELYESAIAGDEDAIKDVAHQLMHSETERAYRSSVGTERSRGLWHSIWVGAIGAFKSLFYTNAEVDRVKARIRAMRPTSAA